MGVDSGVQWKGACWRQSEANVQAIRQEVAESAAGRRNCAVRKLATRQDAAAAARSYSGAWRSLVFMAIKMVRGSNALWATVEGCSCKHGQALVVVQRGQDGSHGSALPIRHT